MKSRLEKIATKTVIQGGHKERITEYFATLVRAAREEFTEDNKFTLDSFLTECFKDALKEIP